MLGIRKRLFSLIPTFIADLLQHTIDENSIISGRYYLLLRLFLVMGTRLPQRSWIDYTGQYIALQGL